MNKDTIEKAQAALKAKEEAAEAEAAAKEAAKKSHELDAKENEAIKEYGELMRAAALEEQRAIPAERGYLESKIREDAVSILEKALKDLSSKASAYIEKEAELNKRERAAEQYAKEANGAGVQCPEGFGVVTIASEISKVAERIKGEELFNEIVLLSARKRVAEIHDIITSAAKGRTPRKNKR